MKIALIGGTPSEHAGEAGRTWDNRKDFAFSSYNYAIGLLRACVRADERARDRAEIELFDIPVGRTQRRLLDRDIEEIVAARPDVVGFSCGCWNVDLFEETVPVLRRALPGVRILAGGPAVSHHPGTRMARRDAFDIVVRGEGEAPFIELCRRGFDRLDDIPGLTWRSGDRIVSNPDATEAVDLATLPSPYLTGTFAPRADGLLIEPSRGCRFRCAFCSWSTRTGGLRMAPTERITAEVDWALRHGHGAANFCDTAINHDTAMLRALCAAIDAGDPERKLRCSAFVRHEDLDDAQLAILSEHPFAEIILGIESTNPSALRTVGKQPIDTAELERRIEAIGRTGSKVTVSLISGLPGDSIDGFAATLDWAEGALARLPDAINFVCCFWLAVLPGTRYEARAEAYGFRTARRGTPYIVESKDHRPGDLVRMSKMLVERGGRNPRLACEEVHRVVAEAEDASDLEAVLVEEPQRRRPPATGRLR